MVIENQIRLNTIEYLGRLIWKNMRFLQKILSCPKKLWNLFKYLQTLKLQTMPLNSKLN